jgi:Cu/Ag efflux protein CusF
MTRLLFFSCFLFAIVAAGCSNSKSNGEKVYDLKGTVVAVNLNDKRIKINHEDIPGLMPAMQMPFEVHDLKLIEGLAAGDAVEGKVKAVDGKYIITELRKTASGSAAIPKDFEEQIQANLAKLSAEDRKLAEAQRLCPVTDERIGDPYMPSPVKIMLKGEPVLLCCKACQKSAEKDPEATLNKIAALKKK